MKSSIITIIWGALVSVGSCALVIAGILAWIELDWIASRGNTHGGWLSANSDLNGLATDVRIAMAISTVIGLVGIVLGWRVRRMKRDLADDSLRNGNSKE